MGEGRQKLAKLRNEIANAQTRLNDILLSADQVISKQARAIAPATFCCRLARVGHCRYHQKCR